MDRNIQINITRVFNSRSPYFRFYIINNRSETLLIEFNLLLIPPLKKKIFFPSSISQSCRNAICRMIFPLFPLPLPFFFSIKIDSSCTRLPAISRVIVLSKAWRAGRHLSQYWPDIGNLRSRAITNSGPSSSFPCTRVYKAGWARAESPRVEIEPRFPFVHEKMSEKKGI